MFVECTLVRTEKKVKKTLKHCMFCTADRKNCCFSVGSSTRVTKAR